MPTCKTCNDTRQVPYDIGTPPYKSPPGTPNLVINVPCPDCVPCDQCAHPDHDGIHTCRIFYEDP